MLFPQMFAAIFTTDAQLIDFAARALRVYLAAMVLFGIQVACQMTFTAIGSAPSSICIAVVRKFVLLIPLIYLLPLLFPGSAVMAVYMAEPIADALAVTFTSILFLIQFKKILKRMREPDVA